jgi:hypothetical protein
MERTTPFTPEESAQRLDEHMLALADRWSGTRRRDGLVVVPGMDGWIIIPGDDSDALDICPCCKHSIRTELAAKFIAERAFPLR